MSKGGLFGRLFGRRKPSALEILQSAQWKCVSCDIEHHGMFDIGARAPDHWGQAEELEPNSALRTDGDFLSEDFCVIGGEHFFVRCVFDIPVDGMAEKFGYGVWSTLSRDNFDRYVDGFDDGKYSDMGPWWGWFSNNLKGFPETINQGCWVHPQLGRQRPAISLDDEGHKLATAQRDGISALRLLELYAEYGHAPNYGGWCACQRNSE